MKPTTEVAFAGTPAVIVPASCTALALSTVGQSGFLGIDCMYGPLAKVVVFGPPATNVPVTLVNSVIWFQNVVLLKVPPLPTSGLAPGRKSLCWSLNSAIWLRMLC